MKTDILGSCRRVNDSLLRCSRKRTVHHGNVSVAASTTVWRLPAPLVRMGGTTQSRTALRTLTEQASGWHRLVVGVNTIAVAKIEYISSVDEKELCQR